MGLALLAGLLGVLLFSRARQDVIGQQTEPLRWIEAGAGGTLPAEMHFDKNSTPAQLAQAAKLVRTAMAGGAAAATSAAAQKWSLAQGAGVSAAMFVGMFVYSYNISPSNKSQIFGVATRAEREVLDGKETESTRAALAATETLRRAWRAFLAAPPGGAATGTLDDTESSGASRARNAR